MPISPITTKTSSTTKQIQAEPAARRTGRFREMAFGLVAIILTNSAYGEETYPLDGLSGPELEIAVKVLRDSDRIDDSSRFSIITLAEPEKAAVLEWQAGERLPRRAFAVIRHQEQVFEAMIDIDKREIDDWQMIENVQPAMIPDEWLHANIIVRSSAAWKSAVSKRGIENIKKVICVPMMPGYFGTEDSTRRRLGRVICYDNSSEQSSWGRPIEGLIATVDFDKKEVIALTDLDPVQIPEGGPAVPKEQPDQIPPVGPANKNFQLSGNWVEWDKWRFHLRVDPRVGPIISSASVRDGERRRSVLYEAYMSEIFVPYMDPDQAWYFRTFLDIGEYGIGSAGVPMQAGQDCPADAQMIDAAFASESGEISIKKGVVCIFERTTGDAAWSHYERAQQASLSRRHEELVVRFIAWLGNYDYVVDWIFTPTGSIKARIGATGIVQVKAVNSRHMSSSSSKNDTAYGRLVAPNTVAVNHDHFFNFRLDLDVDGTRNNFVVDKLERRSLDETQVTSPRKSIWQLESETIPSESGAKRTIDLQNPAIWRVLNTGAKNAHGQHVSYQLRPGGNAVSLLDRASFPQRRAAFTNHHLWVTPYARDERYAAGKYPNQHAGGAGLPDWTSEDRPVQNTDIVLWYTVGMHHAVRTEDWPIMPVLHHEFELRPFDYFDHNPSITDDTGKSQPNEP
jgi:primary-amine oxidase